MIRAMKQALEILGNECETAELNSAHAVQVLQEALAEAEKQAPISNGYRLVPNEPTPDMKSAALDNEIGENGEVLTWDEATRIYKAMLSASPAPAQKTLTGEQVGKLTLEVGCDPERDDPVLIFKLVRAVEAWHGIKESK